MHSGFLKRMRFSLLFALACAALLVLAASCGGPAPTPTSPPPTSPPPTEPPAPTAVPPTDTPPPPPAASAAPTAQPTVPSHPGLPLVTFVTEDFTGSGNCAVCHRDLADEAGNDVSMDTHWRSAMMGNGAKDPFWLAQVAVEVARHPALGEVIQDKCSTCHMPMAHTQAGVSGDPRQMMGDGFLNPDNPLHIAAMDGISCAFCHQIQDANLGQPETFSGHYPIDTSTSPPDRPIFGPFDGQRGRMMQASVGFAPVFGEQTLGSELCATCHMVYTPFVDAEGNVQGEFPEQTPYLEWLHSGEEEACQGCHMPEAQGQVQISAIPRNLPGRSPFVQHHFVGGNVFMIRIHQSHVEDLELTASTEQLQATLDRTLAQLQEHAARLSISDISADGGTLSVGVQVEVLAGHKFPTGYPSRRAWIHLTVVDAGGEVIFESGKPKPDGTITGCDADEDALAYEPHYDLISSPEQVQIYEPIMANFENEVTYTLLRAAQYVKDNRLLPPGFDKATAGEDIAVVGGAAQDDDFVGGSDEIAYRVDVSGSEGPFTVSAELLYQTVSYRFAENLRGEAVPLAVRFVQYYDEADKMPVVIATAQAATQ